jgi:carboxyl-terminal processing protease
MQKFTVNKFLIFVLWFVLIGANLSINAQIPANKRLEIYEEVWNTINEKYYDANFNGINWTEIYKKYRPQIETADNEKSFYALLDQMAGELRDSHTRVYSPEQTARRKIKQTASVGLTLKEVENAVVIFSVAPDSEAARLGIKAGLTVSAINDQSVKTAIEEARRAVGVSSSKQASKTRVFSKLLSGELNTPLTLKLKNLTGENQLFTLTRRIVSNKSPFVAKVLPSNIAYLKLPEFDEENRRKFEAAFEEYKNSSGLILDLRGNGGGDGDIGLNIARRFLPNKTSIAKLITRNGKSPLPTIPMTLEIVGDASKAYLNPFVILIDENTASTSELIANALQEQSRAAIFGTNSCGCVLVFLDYKKLTGGGSMTMSEFGFISAKGKTLEGSGITPDKFIPASLEDVRSGRDAALEEAVKYLMVKAKETTSGTK